MTTGIFQIAARPLRGVCLLLLSLLAPVAFLRDAKAQFLFPNPAFRTEYGCSGAIAADLNGDGIPDFVTVSNSYNAVVVLIGKGDGTFSLKHEYNTGYGPGNGIVADLNGDGFPDIIVTSGNRISVFLNYGNGSFAPRTDYPVAAAAYPITIADFNGDNIPDIAAGNYDNTVGTYVKTLSFLYGNGDGTFRAHTDYPVDVNIQALASGDVNGDGRPDLLITNTVGAGAVVSALLNNGDGTYAPRIDYPVGKTAGAATLADVNGDGKPDIITLNSGTYGPPAVNGSISVLLNRGAGVFAPRTDLKISPFPAGLLVSDVTGDGLLDVVYTDSNNTLTVLPGNGAGSFSGGTSYSVGGYPGALAAADYNGDGIVDLIASNGGQDVTLLMGKGGGAFNSLANVSVGAAPQSVALADVNGDGRPDLITASATSNTVSVAFGKGDGTFAPKLDYPVSIKPIALLVADCNKDGKPDLLVLCQQSGSVDLLLNNGAGTFGAKTSFSAVSSPLYFAAGDLDGDGNLDVVATGASGTEILYGNGKGKFPSGSYMNAAFGPLAIGDVTGDGKADIVASLSPFYISVLPNSGNRVFGAEADYRVTSSASWLTLADINGDGRLDVLFSSNASYGAINVLLNYGASGFPQNNPTVFPVDAAVRQFSLADINGDGKLDVVTANYNSNSVSILLGDSHGGFSAGQNYLTGNGPAAVAAGDLNGDGRPEVVTVNMSGNNVTVLPNVSGAYAAVSGVVSFESLYPYASARKLTFLFRPVGGGPTIVKTTGAPAIGIFNLIGVPKNEYQVRIKGSGALAAALAVRVMGDLSGLQAFLPGGDANNDNSVDSSDFAILLDAFSSSLFDYGSGYDSRADFNGDGYVDSTDFGILIGNYNQQGAP